MFTTLITHDGCHYEIIGNIAATGYGDVIYGITPPLSVTTSACHIVTSVYTRLPRQWMPHHICCITGLRFAWHTLVATIVGLAAYVGLRHCFTMVNTRTNAAQYRMVMTIVNSDTCRAECRHACY